MIHEPLTTREILDQWHAQQRLQKDRAALARWDGDRDDHAPMRRKIKDSIAARRQAGERIFDPNRLFRPLAPPPHSPVD